VPLIVIPRCIQPVSSLPHPRGDTFFSRHRPLPEEYSKCVATLSEVESQGQTPDVNHRALRSMPGPHVFACTGWWVIATLIGSRCSPTLLGSVSSCATRECGGGPRLQCTSCAQKCDVLGSWTLTIAVPGFTRPQPNPESMSFEFFKGYVEHRKKEGRCDYQLRVKQTYAFCMIQCKIRTLLTFPSQHFSLFISDQCTEAG
jgi:hypothetical protein